MKKGLYKVVIIGLVLLLCFNTVVLADESNAQASAEETKIGVQDNISESYNAYINSFSDYSYATEDIVLPGNVGIASEDTEILNIENENAIALSSGSVTYSFEVPANAFYNISIKYKALGDSGMDAQLAIKLDGIAPFSGAEMITVPTIWQDAGEIRTDDFGNQFSPEQVMYDDYVTKPLYDDTGVVLYPYDFAFSAGKHNVTIELLSGELAIAEVILSIPDDSVQSYSEIKKKYKENGYTEYDGKAVVIEGENAALKNSNSIIAVSDNTSKVLTPSSTTNSVINYIGSNNWSNSTQEITWNVSVPESGLYKLGLMYKQDQVVNGYSYRHLRIDGRTPFAEAAAIGFYYDTEWKFYEFADDSGEEYLFYLTEGEHQLSMSVTLGPQAEFYSRLKKVTASLGDFYIDVVMITGESPDKNRDYELFKQIPDYYETLQGNYDEMMSLVEDVKSLTGAKGSNYIAAIQNMSRVVKSMIDDSYLAHRYVTNYYSNYVTLSSWLYEMTVMPLSVDQVRFAAPAGDFGEKEVGFFEKLFFSFLRFIYSFSSDYMQVSENDEDAIKIWVNWGRDQAQVLNSLIQESFTPETGIQVNLEIVNADLIKGILSDNQPDLALHMSRATPVNLAMRGALYDLTEFDDYDEVMERFGESAAIPYEYGDGVYALPDQQAFYLMFYRTDIFEELGLAVPETWEEFLATTAVLQRNNMNSYIPYTKISAANTTDTGVGGLNLFASILMQHGGSLYNEDRSESLLASTTSLNAFKYWTNMYTQYKLPTEADFYNRFRVGTCPLGIAVYTQYTTFLQAAPEIQGRWGIALVPGIEQEDGSINRTVSGSGTGCAILEKSEKKDEAWEFLKWWTSEETQTRYNANVESILGAISRTTTANLNAFAKMGWDEDDLEILLEQRSYIEEIPEIPGSYYLTRSVDQAFWSVINGNSSVKDALSKWGREANEEIKRKISEYEGEVS